MRTGRLHIGLDRLAPPPERERIVVIFLESWSSEAQDVYDAVLLAGDTDQQAAITRQETAEAVKLDDGSLITLIEVRTRDDGPA